MKPNVHFLLLVSLVWLGCGSEKSQEKGFSGEGSVSREGIAVEVDTTVQDSQPSETLRVAPLGEEDPDEIRKAKEGGELPERENVRQEDAPEGDQ